MLPIIIFLLLICTPSFAEETYRVQVITKDYVPELGHDYSDAQYINAPLSMTLQQVKDTYGAGIVAEKEKRIAARIEEKNNPPKQVEPTKEELEEAKAQLVAQVAELSSQIAVARPRAVIDAEKVVALEEIA